MNEKLEAETHEFLAAPERWKQIKSRCPHNPERDWEVTDEKAYCFKCPEGSFLDADQLYDYQQGYANGWHHADRLRAELAKARRGE